MYFQLEESLHVKQSWGIVNNVQLKQCQLATTPGSNSRKLIKAWEAKAGVHRVLSPVQLCSGCELSIFSHLCYLTLMGYITTLGLGTQCTYNVTAKLLHPSLSFLFCNRTNEMIMPALQRNLKIQRGNPQKVFNKWMLVMSLLSL